ncbi:MAG: hypothetical protein ACKVU4_00105 [Phycisphaerales bacterium]
MTKTLGVALAALAAIMGACQRYQYKLDLRPRDGGLERTLNWSISKQAQGVTSLPVDDLQRIAGLYGAAIPAEPVGETVLASTFSGPMPDDIGGFGRYMTLESSLGTLHVYAERFRGSDDALARWERQSTSIDAIVDLWMLYMGDALRGEPGLEALQTVMDRRLRRDLKNAAMTVTAHLTALIGPNPLARSPEEVEEASKRHAFALAARLLLYFMERGYVSPDDASRALRIANVGEPDSSRERAAMIRRTVSGWMDPDAATENPALKSIFDDTTSMSERFTVFVIESEQAWGVLARWVAAVGQVGAESTDTRELLNEVMMAALSPELEGLMDNHDTLDATLATGTHPLMTNGLWNEADASVRWNASLPTDKNHGNGFPSLACAVWVSPDEPAQMRALGRVALQGQSLAEFCLWRRGLLPDEGRQWNAFVEGLTPETNPVARLAAFRFTGRESEDEPPRGVTILRDAILKK